MKWTPALELTTSCRSQITAVLGYDSKGIASEEHTLTRFKLGNCTGSLLQGWDSQNFQCRNARCLTLELQLG
jgi:hypothetical protein